MSVPKPVRAADIDPVVAAFDNAPEEPMTDEERAAFEEALACVRRSIVNAEIGAT